MIFDFLQAVFVISWWLRLLERSPWRALIVLGSALAALVVLIAGIMRLSDPRLVLIGFGAVVVVATAVCLWASLTGPERSPKSASPDHWSPPSSEEVDRALRGRPIDEP
jgi:hypothetical protein